MKFSLAVFLFCCLALSCKQQGKTYYIDSLNGNDENSGRQPEHAWKSTDRIAKASFQAGDSILFIPGDTIHGTIIISGFRGTGKKPLVISSSGKGKAVISSGDSAAIIIKNSSCIKLSRIRVIGSGRLSGNRSDGILFSHVQSGTIDSVDVSGYLFSGIHVSGGNDIRITRSEAHENGFSGIFAESGEKEYGTDGSKFKTLRNIYIARCKARNNPGCPVIKDNHSGSGILIAGVADGIIEYCEATDNGWDMPREGNGPVGIWTYMSDSVTIRYCYSHHNKTSAKGKDGGGFDFDGGVRFSVMEHNLSAFNEGAGYGIFQYAGATEWTDNTIRNNISFNDGIKNSRSGIFMWCDPAAIPMKNFVARDNMVVTAFEHAVAFEPGHYENFVFSGNTFQISGGNEFVTGIYSGASFESNIQHTIGDSSLKADQIIEMWLKTTDSLFRNRPMQAVE